ncbi:MAG: GNAT family N-acetyltransferase [Rhizobium rhizophilum]|uniref:GNAT family N-acetyltransferase n=1 Tax=Rhizobium rhizophilum TaxID=1850373 RepID=UPI00391A647D
MQHFLIRLLSADDAPVFREIRLAGLQNHPEAFGADIEDESSRSVEWFADRLRNSAVFGGFNEARELCGLIAVARSESPKTRHSASIWGMYVKAAYRGTGLSASLLNVAVTYAFEHCSTVRLAVVESNHAARRLYSKAGFREWARDLAALKVGDVFHDEIMMRLDKPPSAEIIS